MPNPFNEEINRFEVESAITTRLPKETAGCVKRVELPSGFAMTYPWTIATRTNGEYIQDKGVQPEATYEITVDDIVNGYAGYRTALLNYMAPFLR